ncbi:hypothetical protein BKA93DRAFT_214914 [Sparassis latifolia]
MDPFQNALFVLFVFLRRFLSLISFRQYSPTAQDEVWKTLSVWGAQYSDVVYAQFLRKPILVLKSLQAAQDLIKKKNAIYSDRSHFTLHVDMKVYRASVNICVARQEHLTALAGSGYPVWSPTCGMESASASTGSGSTQACRTRARPRTSGPCVSAKRTSFSQG